METLKDLGNCYSVAARRDIDGLEFRASCSEVSGEHLITRSGFSFRTQLAAIDWLEPQVPQLNVSI
ncbi:hypothetical protein GCM10011415_27870 [Salipiger pallidus]|uniref:Uncharacterized protein n=1 Tax=Salipiger pallidus TaxID=1775170 RepID=A0A8J2ZKZ6_9RHOB|nr:hypothetical protein GCM10011415_27870 [Salipiger pallidus]